MCVRVPPLEIKIVLESNSPKSTKLVGGLAVRPVLLISEGLTQGITNIVDCDNSIVTITGIVDCNNSIITITIIVILIKNSCCLFAAWTLAV